MEVCDSLSEGGTTPSFGTIVGAIEAASKSHTKVNVLIRPRAGDFCYTPREVQAMVRDIAVARLLGADGVVVGALTPTGAVDFIALRAFVRAAKEPLSESLLGTPSKTPLSPFSREDSKNQTWPSLGLRSPAELPKVSVTFHRAFDVLRPEVDNGDIGKEVSTSSASYAAVDVETLLSTLANAGVDRLLTSGMAPSAWEGRHIIMRLQVKLMNDNGCHSFAKLAIRRALSLTSFVYFLSLKALLLFLGLG